MCNVEFKKIVNETEERLGKDQNYLLDSEKLRSIFNWKDKINLDEGISKTLNWVNTNLLILNKLPWEYQHKL